MQIKYFIIFSLFIFSYESIAKECHFRISGLKFYKNSKKIIMKNYQKELKGNPSKISINKRENKIIIDDDAYNCKEIKKFLTKIGFKGIHRKRDKKEIEEENEKIFRNPESMIQSESSGE